MGYDDIPVGMRPESVVVRAKAKAPQLQQFKKYFRSGRMLNPHDEYAPEKYVNAAEPTGYGFTSQNNFRPRHQEKEIDKEVPFLSAVRGDVIIGFSTSKRKDRMLPLNTTKNPRVF